MERDADRSREAILAAAERVFAECGFGATSLKVVGDEAGVSRGTPSYFFGSKSGLYDAVLARVVERARTATLDTYRRAEKTASLDDTVRPFVEALLKFLAGDATFVRLIQWEALADASRVEKFFGQFVDDALTAFAPAADRARVPVQRLVLDVIALCWYPFAHEHTVLPSLQMSPRDPKFVKEHIEHIIRILMNFATDGG